MKNFKIINSSKIIFLVVLIVLFTDSCKTKFYEAPDAGPATAGSVNFSKYVAVGSTISSGFADNALYNEGQEFAYPNLIAARILEVNPVLQFNQPNIHSNSGWSGTANKGRFILEIPSCTTVAIGGIAQPGENAVLAYTGNKSKLTNLSVPFIRITNINTPTVSAGTAYNNPLPYYNNITSGGTLGIASEAKARKGTFFTVWLGYVDALRYATSGGTTALVTSAAFKQNIEDLLDSLLATPGSKGVIGNVPYVDQFAVIFNSNRRLTSTSDPARNPVYLTNNQVNNYNASLGSNVLNGGPGFNKNYFVIKTGTGSIRQLNVEKDFIVRANVLDSVGIGPRDSLAVRNCTPNYQPREQVGLLTPINTNAVLDEDEIITLRNQIDAYNAIIVEAVLARNAGGTRLAIVDLNDFYTRLNDPKYGIHYGTQIIRGNHANLGPDYGGFYSLDRIQPTPKGHALLANEFIKVINANFGSNLHLFDPALFRGNLIPTP
jgi:hypothetical protein